MRQPWFAPKRYGYGARPITWQGWALTSGFVLVLLAVMLGLADPWRWLVVVPLTPGFLWLCRARTSAPWRWRWGGAPGATPAAPPRTPDGGPRSP